MVKQLLAGLAIIFFSSCLRDKYEPFISDSGYPPQVESILVRKCTNAGCHNANDKGLAGNLDLSRWEALFNGSVHGSVAVPYSPLYSPLLYYINTEPANGPAVTPLMPEGQQPLSLTEYNILRDWIIGGAQDVNGKIKFHQNPVRRKIYIANKGCDVITVIDAATGHIMNYVEAGIDAVQPEKPSEIYITPDNQKWIVMFEAANIIQVFDAATDVLLSTISLDAGEWRSCVISSDSHYTYVTNNTTGKVSIINIENYSETGSFQLYNGISAIALNNAEDTLYIGNSNSSYMYKVPVANPIYYQAVNLDGPVPGPAMEISEILFLPGNEYYAVSCESAGLKEVRIYKILGDRLEENISLNAVPSSIAVSASQGLMFITCEDDTYFPAVKGSLRVIDLDTFDEVNKIACGWQPNGVAVDEAGDYIYVSNRNLAGSTLPSLYPSLCNGQNGNLTVLKLSTLQVLSRFTELSVDPAGIAVRN